MKSSACSNIMKLEFESAANFIVHLIRQKNCYLGEAQLCHFKNNLIDEFKKRYQNHWFPGKPFKGSGYRCIRINHRIEPLVIKAGKSCKLSHTFLLENLPELTMWIDPLEVCYRFKESSPICILIDKNTLEVWTHKPSKKTIIRKNQVAPETYMKTKTSLIKNIDHLLDSHQYVSIEDLAAYVMS
jgi:protein Tob/BTG